MTEQLRIDGQRLWDSLMEMARIGATGRGGCNRQALTDEDRRGRDLFVSWCRAAGCGISVDEMGNIFARRPGTDDSLPPVITGSHLDTQPTGGKFDGVYGVLAGLEVMRTLQDAGVDTQAPLEVVVWTNEEGARFAPAMVGSGVWAGEMQRDEIYAITDKAGKSFGEELERIGYRGEVPARPKPVRAAFEAHIEQGPILEAEGLQIGVLTGVQGCRWYDLVIVGQPVHAGPTPMEVRRDPFMAALPILQFCYDLAARYAPWGRATFGDIRAEPGSRNTVPEKLVVSVDLRHPDPAVLDAMDRQFRDFVDDTCAQKQLEGRVEELWHMPVTVFDPDCVEAVRSATRELGYSHMEMVSGAGHDSLYLAKVAPTSMIFVPCEGGISHNEAENARQEDLEAGCNVLLQAMLKMAG
ncbi:MAG: Zn-dependent hydrolase [Halieaceae bacterium]|jgi:N-carbamoyl-L-amino-acid hydrolase|nr:Zn-dependent hydrolase [Halieaceae bacterium]